MRLAVIEARWSERGAAMRLAAAVSGGVQGCAPIVVAPAGPEAPTLVGPAIEVVAVRLGDEEGRALTCALQLARERPWLQFVFWYAENTLCPEVEVARSLGIDPVLSETQAQRWLIGALPALARYSRARRELLEAAAGIPRPPPADEGPARTTLSLPRAEQRFREIFLRGVLASTRSFKEAAMRAGIPYTSFCSMLQKLAIRPTGSRTRRPRPRALALARVNER